MQEHDLTIELLGSVLEVMYYSFFKLVQPPIAFFELPIDQIYEGVPI